MKEAEGGMNEMAMMNDRPWSRAEGMMIRRNQVQNWSEELHWRKEWQKEGKKKEIKEEKEKKAKK